MLRYLFLLFSFVITPYLFAGKITGKITSTDGELLAFSSVSVKGQNISTSANSQGIYFMELPAGTYTIVCRHVGYERQEKTIVVSNGEQELNFVLSEQKVSLKEVVVKAGAEDPAYAIIRNAIRKRKEYLNENEVYQCEVYSKGVMNLRNFPKSFMGEKVDFEDGDTSKRKMIYLSETVSKLSVDRPNKIKIDVISTRVSGQSDGFGFAGGKFFSFYENIVQISNALNPRGFVSPIAENALSMYKYKYEGAFSEDGKLINRIKVIPKRKYEPCFSGYINIVEDEWRIHSLELQLVKENQMSFADTLRIEQLYQMLGYHQWVMQSQVLYPSVKFFGFDVYGSFANVYRQFNLQPVFEKKHFNNTVLRYEKGSNKKSVEYWDSIRPITLSTEEYRDYIKKDSLEQLRKSPAYLDSLDRINNKIKPSQLILLGKTFNQQSRKMSYSFPALITMAGFNPVDGLVIDVPVTIRKQFTDRKSLQVIPHIRYGFVSRDLYGWGTIRYTFGNTYFSSVSVSGGRRYFQFNNENPIQPFQNTFSALLYKNNFMKIYAADYFRAGFTKGIGKGVSLFGSFQFQNRMPLDNHTEYSWSSVKTKPYTPNYPTELSSTNFTHHQASILSVGVTVQPGAKYIEFPDRIINIGTKWPVFTLQYTKGINQLLGSDVDYDKWQFTLSDQLNMKLLGRFSYRFQTGGFLNDRKVQIQDMKHFAGNRLFRAEDYMNTFQLPSYYHFSNTDQLYGALYAEHHFNGFLTNKIPGFRKLNWNLTAGASALWLKHTNYYEWHVGFENILRVFRVDFVTGYLNGTIRKPEFRIGTNIIIGGGDD